MSFADPQALRWLWALALIPILYLVRRRARREVVPQLFLWERVLERQGRARLSRVRELLSMLLQLVIGAALILAWAGPQREESRPEPGRVVVLVDTSWAMAARDAEGASRLDRARRAIADDIESILGIGPAAVAGVGDVIHPVCGSTPDASEVVAALARIPEPSGRLRPDAVRGVLRAESGEGAARVVLYTAGAVEGLDELASEGLLIRPVREAAANAGLVSLEVMDGLGPHRAGVRVGLAARGGPVSGRLVMAADDAGELAAEDVTLDDGASLTVELEGEAAPDQWLTVRLEAGDALAADDRVDFWHSRSPKARVLLVADRADRFLQRSLYVLDGILDRAAAAIVSPADWRRAEGYDVVIMKDVTEDRRLPPGRYLLIRSWAPGLPLRREAETGDVEVVKQRKDERLLRGLDLRDLGIERAERVTALRGAVPVLEGSSGSLISRGERDGVRFVHLAFDTSDTNTSLVLLPAFPLLIQDALTWLAPDRRRVFPRVARAGGSITAVPLEGATDDPVLAAAGEGPARELRVTGPGPTVEAPLRPGRVRLRLGDEDEPCGIGVLDERVTDVRSRFAPARAEAPWPEPPMRPAQADLTPMLLLIALTLLVLEWLLFNLGWTR